jgi:hypothetical protein
MIQIEGTDIIFKNGKRVIFDFLVKKIIEIEEVVIILIIQEVFPIIYNENVFAYTINGELLWRVEKLNKKFLGRGKGCPYIDIFQGKCNELRLHNWCDFGYVVNPKTGEISSEYEHR